MTNVENKRNDVIDRNIKNVNNYKEKKKMFTYDDASDDFREEVTIHTKKTHFVNPR